VYITYFTKIRVEEFESTLFIFFVTHISAYNTLKTCGIILRCLVQ